MSRGVSPSDSSSTPLLVADRIALTVSAFLLSAAALSWVAAYYLMPLMSAPGPEMRGVASLVSSLSLTSVTLFELIWVIAMVAMMFPAMIPIILFYNKIATNVEPNPSMARAVGTPLFLLGYLVTYAGLGLLAYFSVFFALRMASSLPALSSLAFVTPSLVLVSAGVYQQSPLKTRCLSYCASPVSFFALHSKGGLLGSVRMGFSHGEYCVGCCWAYTLVMLVVAGMSLPFMAIFAGVIALEKVIVRGANWFSRTIAAGFILLGITALFAPGLLVVL